MAIQKLTTRERRKARVRAKISGSAEKPRLTVFRSLNHIYAQLIDDNSGVVLAQASDIKSKEKGTKTEKAKVIGVEIAKKAQEKKITTVVFDRNGYKYHGRVKAVAEAAREGGLKF